MTFPQLHTDLSYNSSLHYCFRNINSLLCQGGALNMVDLDLVQHAASNTAFTFNEGGVSWDVVEELN